MNRLIATNQFGKVEVSEKQIIEFPDGIPGFDSIKTFALIEESDSPMVWLQAVEESDLAFVMLGVLDFMLEYDLAITQSELDKLKTAKLDELSVYAILTIPQDDPSKMTANLMGPIIINQNERVGRQIISASEKYKTKHLVLDELKKKNEGRG